MPTYLIASDFLSEVDCGVSDNGILETGAFIGLQISCALRIEAMTLWKNSVFKTDFSGKCLIEDTVLVVVDIIRPPVDGIQVIKSVLLQIIVRFHLTYDDTNVNHVEKTSQVCALL